MRPLSVFIALMGLGSAEVSFPEYYYDGMVFQADVSDNLIWGFTDVPDAEVIVQVECFSAKSGQQIYHLRSDPRFVDSVGYQTLKVEAKT